MRDWSRTGAAWRTLGAVAIAAALASGCVMNGSGYDPLGGTARRRPPVHDDDYGDSGRYDRRDDRRTENAYDDGYTRGWGDREQGRAPDYERWTSEYDQGGESAFRAGYADGYQRRPHRYGEAGPEITPAAPDWLIGEFAGYDENADVEVLLQVRRDGGVRLVGGGRTQEGVYRDGRLELRKGTWRVERVRGGVVISPEWDSRSAVRLTRR